MANHALFDGAFGNKKEALRLSRKVKKILNT